MNRLVVLTLMAGALLLTVTGQVRSAILYPCGCAEYYEKTCTNCEGTDGCDTKTCSRTKSWKSASCKQYKDPGTCTVNTEQPGYEDTYEEWTCESKNGACSCPTSDPTTSTTTPVTVSLLINPTNPCPQALCNLNKDCIPK